MHLIYIDDSKDEQQCVFSALAIPIKRWQEVFAVVKEYRHTLRDKHGIRIYDELHAHKFVKGRGSRIAGQMIPRALRCQIFKDTLTLIAALPEVRIFNVSFPIDREAWAFERLLNRINRTMQTWDSHAILMCDEGKEAEYTRLVRRMGRFNPIHSKYGKWGDGSATRNLVIERIIEDPIFKQSDKSYFIQLADFCAYALLRHDRPTGYALKYGLNKAFLALEPITIRETAPRDPMHVIRYT
jgi:hypothetical protein